MSKSKYILYHAHDPMCSWCWGFKPQWQRIQAALPESVQTQYLLGGLAPDSNDPMPEQMQTMLQQVWQRIAVTIPGTQFNHDFWTTNKPRRSTYPACRAVLAAKAQGEQFEEAMITAIQHAYYLQAKNPSNDETLIELADSIGCDVNAFKQSLNSSDTNKALMADILRAQSMGATGFPSLFLEPIGKTPTPIALNYNDANSVLEQVDNFISV